MRSSGPVVVLLGMGLAGCASDMRASYLTTASCIHDQFYTAVAGLEPARKSVPAVFARAVTTCGDPVPDLTGDTMVQAAAILYHVPFRVDLAKDTRIKKSINGQIIGVGSMIPVTPMVFKKT